MISTNSKGLVLSLYVTTRGFAYVLFEGPTSPIDWGVREITGPDKNTQCSESIIKLIETHNPDAVVLEDCRAPSSRRSRRVYDLYRAVEAWTANRGIDTYHYSRDLIRQTFGKLGAATKDEIAEVIGKHIPAFEHRRPPARKIWMSEDARMGLFDATALVLTFFHLGVPDP